MWDAAELAAVASAVANLSAEPRGRQHVREVWDAAELAAAAGAVAKRLQAMLVALDAEARCPAHQALLARLADGEEPRRRAEVCDADLVLGSELSSSYELATCTTWLARERRHGAMRGSSHKTQLYVRLWPRIS